MARRSGARSLEERFSYLFHRISAHFVLIGNRHFKSLALNHYSARILVLLLQHGALRTGDLVAMMLLPQSTISTQLQALHARRLVLRRRDDEDNRSVIVTLTGRGRLVAADCDALSRRVQSLLARTLGGREQAALERLLAKVDAGLARLQGRTLHRFSSRPRR